MKNFDVKYFLFLVFLSIITYFPFHFISIPKNEVTNLENGFKDGNKLTNPLFQQEMLGNERVAFYYYQ